MAVKRLAIDELGEIGFYKRRGTRSIHIYIRGDNIKVTLPYWVTYNRAVQFVQSRKDWIIQNQKPKPIFSNATIIGKHHSVQILSERPVDKLQCRVNETHVTVKLPSGVSHYDDSVQQKIYKAAERALLKQSQQLLESRVKDLSFQHNIPYNKVSFKKLRGRWGSCDNHSNIILNIFLVQLPWNLIDYVIIHELAHTIHHNHSKAFWQVVAEMSPDYKLLRKQIKEYHPHIIVS